MSYPQSPKRTRAAVTDHAALVQPAVRTVCLLASAAYDPDAPGEVYPVDVSVYPVLAVRHRTRRHYSRRTDTGREKLHDVAHADVIADGWWFDGQADDVDVLVAPAHGDLPELCGVDDLREDCDGLGVVRVVACPWPAEEDEAKLSAVVEEMRVEAVRTLRHDLGHDVDEVEVPA